MLTRTLTVLLALSTPAMAGVAQDTARAQRIRAWEAYCKPVVRIDALGVSRYTYADKRCEHGYFE